MKSVEEKKTQNVALGYGSETRMYDDDVRVSRPNHKHQGNGYNLYFLCNVYPDSCTYYLIPPSTCKNTIFPLRKVKERFGADRGVFRSEERERKGGGVGEREGDGRRKTA